MQFRVEIIIGLCLNFAITNISADYTIFKAKSIECITNPKLIVNTSCQLIAVSWIKSYIDADCYLVKPISNVIIETNFFKKDNTNQFKPFLFAFNFSVCNVGSKYQPFPYADYVVEQLQTYTNINHSCPYAGHMFARQLFSNTRQLSNIPFGEYKLLFRFFEKYQMFGQVKSVVEIFESRKVKQKPKVLSTNTTKLV